MSSRTMLIQVSNDANANKFYEVTVGDDGTVTARWGRVGASGQSKVYGTGQHVADRQIARKKAKGYTEVDIVDSAGSAERANLTDAAKVVAEPAFRDDDQISKLIAKLVRTNAHAIKAASGGKITIEDGQVKTPLGVLSVGAINEARSVLDSLAAKPAKPGDLLDQYMSIVPQKVGRSVSSWRDSFMADLPDSARKQSDFLDQLEQSVNFSLAQSRVNTDDGDDEADESAFRMRLAPNTDDKAFSFVSDFFTSTKNDRHHRYASGFKVNRLFDLRDTQRADQTDKRIAEVGNVKTMWHGTRVSNVLSILASGLYVPPAGASFTAGRMFGNGVYMSEQSTKSLNYSTGYWSSGSNADDGTCYMLLCEAATGKQYRPSSCNQSWDRVHKNHDSIWVKPGTAGVLNHECVVWDLDQIRFKYLVEFTR